MTARANQAVMTSEGKGAQRQKRHAATTKNILIKNIEPPEKKIYAVK